MKKVLLGTSALIAAGLIASPAAAQLEVTVSGFVNFEAAVASEEDNGTVDNPIKFATEPEVAISANGQSDIGLLYGGQIQLNADNDDGDFTTDEAFIYVSGGFGYVELGMNDGAADNLQVHAPGAGTGIIDGAYTDYAVGEVGAIFSQLDSGDDNKISWLSSAPGRPGVQALTDAGITIGVSYSPWNEVNDTEDDGSYELGADGMTYTHAIEAAARIQRTFGAADIALGAGMTFIGDQTVAATALVQNPGGGTTGARPETEGHDGVIGWNVGGTVGFGGFTVGAQFVDSPGRIAGQDAWGVTAGAAYTTGPWTFGLQYNYSERDVESASNRSGSNPITVPITTQTYGAGISYAWMPGLALHADVVGFDVDGNSAARGGNDDDNGGVVGLTRVSLSF